MILLPESIAFAKRFLHAFSLYYALVCVSETYIFSQEFHICPRIFFRKQIFHSRPSLKKRNVSKTLLLLSICHLAYSQNKGRLRHPFGARMRIDLDTVGAMRSVLTTVEIRSG